MDEHEHEREEGGEEVRDAVGEHRRKTKRRRLIVPSDVVELDPEAEDLSIIGTAGKKVTKVAGLEGMTKLTVRPRRALAGAEGRSHVLAQALCIRSHLVTRMEGIEHMTELTNLEFYDNQIKQIQCLAPLTRLT